MFLKKAWEKKNKSQNGNALRKNGWEKEKVEER